MTWEIAVGFFTIISTFSAVLSSVMKVNRTLTQLDDSVRQLKDFMERQSDKNEAFGISFDVPAEWYFLTDEEIAQTMGSTAEQLFGEDVLAQADYIYDLYCVDMESGTTVSINYENLGTIGEFTEESEYLETVLAQLLSGTNPGITAAELSVAKVGKTTVPCLNITLEAGGNTIYESIIVKKIGTWIGTVTMATLEEAELETLAASISFE